MEVIRLFVTGISSIRYRLSVRSHEALRLFAPTRLINETGLSQR